MNAKCSHVWYLYPDDGSATLHCCKCKVDYEDDDIGDYVTGLTQRAERAEARVKRLELDVMSREGYIETLEAIIAKTQLQINGITINRKSK